MIVDVGYVVSEKKYAAKMIYDRAAPGPRPGILLSPNFFGVTDDAIRRAEILVAQGFVVFVADVHGEGKSPSSFEEADAFAASFKSDSFATREVMSAALRAFRQAGEEGGWLDSECVAAIGFCLGGRNVLELARSGELLTAVVSIHGEVASDKPGVAKVLTADVLAIHGSKDPLVPAAQLLAFQREMESCDVKWRLLVYGGLYHAFTDPGTNVPGVAVFDEVGCADSYAAAIEFIRHSFPATADTALA